jgi:outer membrane protein assembly factor BamB
MVDGVLVHIVSRGGDGVEATGLGRQGARGGAGWRRGGVSVATLKEDRVEAAGLARVSYRGTVLAGLSAAVMSLVVGCGTSSPQPTAATGGGVTADAASPTAVTGAAGPDWAGYHADQARTGALPAGPAFDAASVAWTAKLGAAVRGQAVSTDGVIVAATERNRVVGLDPASGRILWSQSVGTPLTNVTAVAGCGNIDPLGITSTPVIDTATSTVYVVGEVSDGHGSVSHQLEGLDLHSGAVRLHEPVDPPLPAGERAVHLLQRVGLALGNGRVYVGFGGNIGDCGDYHGWLVGVEETGPARLVSFEVAPDGEGGAIWQSGGAPALDSAGNVYVSTGNANPFPPGTFDPKQYAESVVKLSPDLRVLAAFKDPVAGGDADLSTGNPVLLPDGNVFAVGKTDIGYVLTQGDLTRVVQIGGICGSDPDGGPAYDRATNRVFVPCRGGGIQVVNLDDHTLGPRLSGADSAPVIIGSNLWALDHATATLQEWNTRSLTRLQTVTLPASTPIFTSPSVGHGLLLVSTDDGIIALH